MTHEDYQAAVMTCALAAKLLVAHDLPAVLAAIDRAEALGPILDPTLYRAKGQAMEEDKRMLEAAVPLWNIGRALRERPRQDTGSQAPATP